MTGKTGRQYFFEVQLNWLADIRCLLTAKDAEGALHVATPPEFGGKGKPWTPEHLFLSSISSGFMTTYLAFAKKLHFEIVHFSCHAIGQVEIREGRYKFTTINVYPVVHIENETNRENARIAMEKTHQHCLISNSVNASIFYHSQIKTEPLPEVQSGKQITENGLRNRI